MKYDVTIIGAGPGGIFSACQLVKKRPDLKVAVCEAEGPIPCPMPLPAGSMYQTGFATVCNRFGKKQNNVLRMLK